MYRFRRDKSNMFGCIAITCMILLFVFVFMFAIAYTWNDLHWKAILVFVLWLISGVSNIIFIKLAVFYSDQITVTFQEIQVTRFGKMIQQIKWNDVTEVGVKIVYNGAHYFNTGEVYIYFSTKALLDADRMRIGTYSLRALRSKEIIAYACDDRFRESTGHGVPLKQEQLAFVPAQFFQAGTLEKILCNFDCVYSDGRSLHTYSDHQVDKLTRKIRFVTLILGLWFIIWGLIAIVLAMDLFVHAL